MNPNQKSPAVTSLLQRAEAENLDHDRGFLELVAKATATLHERAQTLLIDLPQLKGTGGYYGNPATAQVTQLTIALVVFDLELRNKYPELTSREVAQLALADTFLGSALGFDFRSEESRGRVPSMPMTMTAAELQVHIGAKLADARKKAGLTQQAVADLSGMSNSSVARIEAGIQRLGISVLYRLLTVLHLHPKEVLPKEAFPSEETLPVSSRAVEEMQMDLRQLDKDLERLKNSALEHEKRTRAKD